MATNYKKDAKNKMIELAEKGIVDAVVFCVQFDPEKYLKQLKDLAIDAEDPEDPYAAMDIWKKMYAIAPEVKDKKHDLSLRKEFR